MTKHTIQIAFLGPQGSYSHIASKKYANIKKFNNIIEYSCKNFHEIILSIQNKKAKYGILPIENSTSGSINEVYDLLETTNLFLIGEINIPIEHCILTIPNTSFQKIKTIYSHPQPIQQCSHFFNNFPKLNTIFCKSSADAMKKVSQLKKPYLAALGHGQSGKLLYGLQVLKKNLANKKNNVTRFIVLSKKNIKISKNIQAKTTLILSTKKQTNTLYEVTQILKTYNIKVYNIKIQSKTNSKIQTLFINIEANIHNQCIKNTLKKLQNIVPSMKILGCYPKTLHITPTNIDPLHY